MWAESTCKQREGIHPSDVDDAEFAAFLSSQLLPAKKKIVGTDSPRVYG